jgi:hypothetical protein
MEADAPTREWVAPWCDYERGGAGADSATRARRAKRLAKIRPMNVFVVLIKKWFITVFWKICVTAFIAAG